MDAKELADEQASIELDILKLQLHSVPLNLDFANKNPEEEEEDEEDGLDEEYLLSAFDDPDQPSTSGLSQQAPTTSKEPATASQPEVIAVDSEDEDEIAVESEQEVIDLSADLQPTPENLLKLNIAYQEVVQQQIHFIFELLHHNKCKQDELTANMNEDTYQQNNPRKARVRADLGLCIAPFFKAGSLGGPPPHPDVLRRHNEIGEEFMENAMTPSPWKAKQVKDLIAGVERDAIRTRTEPLLSTLEYLEEKFQMNPSKELKEKMKDVRQKILEAKELKPSVLHGDRLDEHDWNSIANIALEGSRTASECSIYWKNHVHPSVNHKTWSSSEDEHLRQLVKKHKERNWMTIAEELKTGRTALQCIQRYQRKLNTTHKRKPWTPEEDEKLRNLVAKYRVGNAIPYCMVAIQLKNRSSSQVAHRWTKTVNPEYSKAKWTAEEDVRLLRAIARHGTRWAYIRDLGIIPGRNDAQMRERYENVLSGVRRGVWTPEEDEQLFKGMDKHGVGNWAAISIGVEGRTDSQCMKRWKHIAELKKQGREIKYKAREASQLRNDGLAKIRQKLMDSIQEELKRRSDKDKFVGGIEVDEKEIMSVLDKPKTTEDEKSEPVSLPKESKIKVDDLKRDIEDPFYFAKELGEKLKDMTTEEVFGMYQYVTSKRVKKPQKWNRKDAMVNINMVKVISERYKPYQVEARVEGTNINIIREKVLETAKKITPRILFTHYIRAMNVDAEKTLSTIRNRAPEAIKKMVNGEPKPPESDGVEEEKEAPEETQEGTSKSSSNFKRNFFLPLCAPNVATVGAYRALMRDRDRRVKSAKTILINNDEPPIDPDAPQTSSAEPPEKRYRPEELIKNIQHSAQYKMFRSRFVSLFAWPTILSTLVPYQRYKAGGELKAAVKLPKREAAPSKDRLPKRRKLDKESGLNAKVSRVSKKRPHDF